MTADVILNFIDSLMTLALVPLILWKARDRAVGRALAAWLFSIGWWSFGVAMHGLATSNKTALFWSWFLHFGAVPLPVLYLNFSLKFLNIRRPRLIMAFSIMAALFLAAVPSKLFIKEVSPIMNFTAFPKAGPLYPLYVVMFSACVMVALYFYFTRLKALKGSERRQTLAIFWGSAVGFGFGSTAFLPEFNIPIQPFGRPLVVLNAVFIAYSIIKHGLMDIKLVIRDTFVHVITTATLVTLCLLVALPMSEIYPRAGVIVGVIGMSLLMIYAYGPIRQWVQPAIDRVVFSNQFAYLEELGQLPNDLLEFTNLNEMLRFLVTRLKDAARLERVRVFMYDPGHQSYLETVVQESSSVSEATRGEEVSEREALVSVLQADSRLWTIDDLNRRGSPETGALLTRLGGAACFPVKRDDELIGLIVLGPKRSGQVFNRQDLKILRALRVRLENFLAQAMSITQEAMNMVKDSHDMKNDVNALKGRITWRVMRTTAWWMDFEKQLGMMDGTVQAMTGKERDVLATALATIRKQTSEWYQDAKRAQPIEEDAVKRMAHRLKNWAEYGRVISEGFRGHRQLEAVDVGQAAKLSVERWRPMAERKSLTLTASAEESLWIWGERSLLEQIIENLIDNAVKATSSGSVHVRCRRAQSSVQIDVEDSGCGIPPEDLKTIFEKPFYQGRGREQLEQSTGVGLYLVAQYVKTLGGQVSAESHVGRGSTFRVSLPLHQRERTQAGAAA